MQRRQKNWLKYTDCAELKKITIRIYSNCSIYSSIFFKSFKFHCCLFCLVKQILQLTIPVSCFIIFVLITRFFEGKLKTIFLVGFIVFFQVGFFKKTRMGFWGRFFTTTLIKLQISLNST